MPEVNLKEWSDDELRDLQKQIDVEVQQRHEKLKQDLIDKVRSLAAEVGVTPEELLTLD